MTQTKKDPIYIGQSSLARSLVSSWLGLALGILLGLFISPLVVHSLDKEFYGYWTIILSICSQLMMLDLGIRSAIVKYVSELRALKSPALDGSTLLSSAAALLMALACLGLLLLLILSFYLPDIMQISEENLSLIQLVFIIMSLEAAIELAFGIFDATLAASERYDLINASNSTRLLVQAILLLIFLQNGAGILAVGLIAFSTRLLQRVLTAYFCYRVQPDLKLKPALVERQEIKKLAHFGGWAALITICSRIIYQIDTLVVGVLLGPIAVAYYAVPLIVIEMYRSLSQSTSTILAPRFSALFSLERREELELILFRWTSFASLLSVLLGMPLLIFGADFLALWMGSEFRNSSEILSLLSIPFFFVLPAMGIGQLLLGAGRHQLYGKILVVEAILNLGCSILFASYLGAPGVALGTLIPAIILRGFLLPFLSARMFGFSYFKYLRKSFERSIPLASLYACILLALKEFVGSSSWTDFVLANSLGLLTILGFSYYCYLDADEKAYLIRRFPIFFCGGRASP